MVTPERLHELMRALGRRCGPGRIYLVGGATALLYGFRESTADVDLKLDPEPPGVFEAIVKLKEELQMNVELAAPDDFIPPLPGWRERSAFVARHGEVDFHHYDFRAQALAKIERGHDRDVGDVRAMLDANLTTLEALRSSFAAIEGQLPRYPRVDAEVFARRLAALEEA